MPSSKTRLQGVEGMSVLVTGGSGDIGSEVCRVLSAAGARVAVHYRRSGKRAKKLAEAIGGIAVSADLTRKNDVRRMIRKVASAFGGIDGLVNAAGFPLSKDTRHFWDNSFERISPAMFREVFEVDFLGTILTCQAALPLMKRKKFGRIVNFSSTPAISRHSKGYPFTAAKAAVWAMTKSLALEAAKYQITVNTLALGNIDTHWFDLYGPEVRARVRRQTPLGRIGTPMDAAAAVRFLLSREAGYITSQTIVVDGGDLPH